MISTKKTFEFSELLNKLRAVERVVRVNNDERWENTVEHSYFLAMLCWYVASTNKSELSVEKVLKYAMAHDLVESYAGDTYLFSEDEDYLNSKEKREKDAAERIASEFPDFEELHKVIGGYESKSEPEAKFVYAMDKIQPLLQIYLDEGRTWKEKNITIKMLYDHKIQKVSQDKDVERYFLEVIDLLKKEEPRLFNSN